MNSLLVYSFAKSQPNQLLKGIDGEPISWVHGQSIFAAVSKNFETSALDFDTKSIEYHPAILYQNVVKNLHKRVDSLPLQFPTVLTPDKLDLFIMKNEQQILKLINTYGNTSEHTIYLRLSSMNELIPDGLRLKSEGVNYLKKKFEIFKVQQTLARHVEAVESAIKELKNEIIDYQIDVSDNALRIHFHCQGKKGLHPSQLVDFIDSISSDLSATELGVFPPFHFIAKGIQEIL
ncbi:MAG: GvpL/GvpF family gas vesicle protein [Bacteroidota bacterium]